MKPKPKRKANAKAKLSWRLEQEIMREQCRCKAVWHDGWNIALGRAVYAVRRILGETKP